MARSYVRTRMKVTVDIGPYLIEEAKDVAAESGKSLDEVISDALCESLNTRRANQQAPRNGKMPTWPGGRVRPGVDLDSNAELLELMESERDSERRERDGVRVPRTRG